MPSTYSAETGLEKIDRYSDEIWTPWSSNADMISRMVAGYLAIAQGDAAYTLADTSGARESRTLALKFTSTLTAARVITIDTTTAGKYRNRLFFIWNASAGDFKLTIKTSAGGSTGVDINAGYSRAVWHDGTNVYALTPEIVPTTGLVAGIPAPAFIAPSLQNSWVNNGSGNVDAGYTKTAQGIVCLRGLIKNGTATPGTLLFTLPVGYRPTAAYNFATNSNGAYGQLSIESDGSVRIQVGSNVYFSLNCSFIP